MTAVAERATTPTAPSLSSARAARLVAIREITTQVRTKGLWLTFGLFVVGIFAMSIGPSMFGGSTTVAVVGEESEQIVAATDFETQAASDVSEAEQLVENGDVDAAIIPDTRGESPVGVRVVGLDATPDDIVAALSVSPPVDLIAPAAVDGGTQFLVTFSFALVFFAFTLGFGMAIAQSVVTEKQTRIVEILVATIPVRALLAGKLIGFTALVFAQITIFAAIAPLALRAGGRNELVSVLDGALGWFVPFFALGFFLLAAMWVTAGAMASRHEELGSTSSVVSMIVMIPYFGVVFWQDNELIMTILSYVPFSAPVAMPVRLFTGSAAGWEPFVAMLILGLTAVACVLAASRLYAGSLLHTSGRVRLRKAWSID